jgi:17beta-estradiol 17-dehydrogenase / very-long-chain 3-oxoacyl-CoA reductase
MKELNLLERYKQNRGGSLWAVVTGATDGIGLEFCKQLAKRGFNIVMISRTQEKLVQKSEEIRKINKSI